MNDNQYDQFINTLLKQLQSNGNGWGFYSDQEDEKNPPVCTTEEWEDFAKQYGLEDGEVKL